MPESVQRTTRRRTPVRRRTPRRGSPHALLVIDDAKLRAAAWAEFQKARQRMDKATRQLERHELIDVPAYQQWLHQTFPTLISAIRDLHADASRKASQVHAVRMQSFYCGGSLKRIWREQRAREQDPEAFGPEPEPEDDAGASHRSPLFPDDDAEPAAAPSLDARAIYRRLVQRLHPDRGGEWTAVRERLWHEVQQAWAAGDADWLARLEVDWETAHDVLGPKSALSRLRRAIAEVDAARRDTERKLRAYRHEPAWRFTRTEAHRAALHRRLERELNFELRTLRQHLENLNRTIAEWEDDWTRPRKRKRAGKGSGMEGMRG